MWGNCDWEWGGITGNKAIVIFDIDEALPPPPPVSGLSFGIISGVFSVINILADALGPGVVGIDLCLKVSLLPLEVFRKKS